MSLKKVALSENDHIFIRDDNDSIGCGNINDDGHLYFIDIPNMVAYQLPDKYKDTPIILYHPCGGYQDGLIMVSLLGEIDLQYHHDFHDTAGIWGWIDLDGNEVIPPQFIYAMSFFEGRAIVCRGKWQIDESGRYRSDIENWGVIDTAGEEIIPCQYDEIYEVEDTDRFYLCHKGGWKDGKNCIYDIVNKQEVVDLDFAFENGYMFNSCFYADGCIWFDEHLAGEETDYISAFSPEKKEWVVLHEKYEQRELNGKTKIVVQKDGEEIIVF